MQLLINDPNLQVSPKKYAGSLFPRASGMSKTSGGIGKKDASAKDIPANAFDPEGFSAHARTQSYILRMNLMLLF